MNVSQGKVLSADTRLHLATGIGSGPTIINGIVGFRLVYPPPHYFLISRRSQRPCQALADCAATWRFIQDVYLLFSTKWGQE